MTIRVLIADDQDSVRFGFRTILRAAEDIEVVAEAADGETALALTQRLRPDVVIADIRMPGMDGLELTRRLCAADAPITARVVVATAYDLDAYVHTALRHGASGFLVKHSGPALLTEAVRAAVAGDALISPTVTVRLLRKLASTTTEPTRKPEPALSDRETEIVSLVADGLTNPEIGDRLYITTGTVKTHLTSIQRKLKVRNRVGIAHWAWETRTHTRTPGVPGEQR
ncbi:response regulator [Plantactinospora endophytica]|uniref:DNA-binding response regulator n=1 Tax=Plantactinospora endophytica TaxID=673535 RepID=A0ABQ4EEE3_9ACTN|nr:response regulator transcription factor [Plantactinospora endophytica]GIG93098.1 DNA-binding response regulator [Plantactinospora endophytica]